MPTWLANQMLPAVTEKNDYFSFLFKKEIFFEHEILRLQQFVEKYCTQKRGLMQKLLTGEWRIKR